MMLQTMHGQHMVMSDSEIKDFETVEKSLTERIEIGNINSTDLALLYNDRGHSKYMQVEFDAAIDDYNKAIEINRNLGVAYYNRATVLYRLGCFEEALKDMKRAVDLEPNHLEFQKGCEACNRALCEQK